MAPYCLKIEDMSHRPKVQGFTYLTSESHSKAGFLLKYII